MNIIFINSFLIKQVLNLSANHYNGLHQVSTVKFQEFQLLLLKRKDIVHHYLQNPVSS